MRQAATVLTGQLVLMCGTANDSQRHREKKKKKKNSLFRLIHLDVNNFPLTAMGTTSLFAFQHVATSAGSKTL